MTGISHVNTQESVGMHSSKQMGIILIALLKFLRCLLITQNFFKDFI